MRGLHEEALDTEVILVGRSMYVHLHENGLAQFTIGIEHTSSALKVMKKINKQ